MKQVALEDVPSLADCVAALPDEPVVLTKKGRAVAAVVAMPNTDAETASLSTNPAFLAIIERSRKSLRDEGGLSPAELRRRLGLKSPSRHRGARRRRQS